MDPFEGGLPLPLEHNGPHALVVAFVIFLQCLERDETGAGVVQPFLQGRYLEILSFLDLAPLLQGARRLAGFALDLTGAPHGAFEGGFSFPLLFPPALQGAGRLRFLVAVSGALPLGFAALFFFQHGFVLQVGSLVRGADEGFFFPLHLALEIAHPELDFFQLLFLVLEIGLLEEGELDELLLGLLQPVYLNGERAELLAQLEQLGLALLHGVVQSGAVPLVEFDALLLPLESDLVLINRFLLQADLLLGFQKGELGPFYFRLLGVERSCELGQAVLHRL